MDSAILHCAKRGLGFDSSHRHKNENFAPVTLLTTVDDYGHMVPGMSTNMSSGIFSLIKIAQWPLISRRMFNLLLCKSFYGR
jgi:hypothetical protein